MLFYRILWAESSWPSFKSWFVGIVNIIKGSIIDISGAVADDPKIVHHAAHVVQCE
jgi:hypothetical protein